jgi:predicted lipid-binding transport protein (Tim44 family)
MTKIFIGFIVAILSFALMIGVADAKRLGGGSSFGKQRAVPTKQYQKSEDSAKPTSPAPAGGNKWLGPLAGLAIGAGLMSLFSGGGLGQGFGGILMALLAAGAIMFLLARLRKPTVAMPNAPNGFARTAEVSPQIQGNFSSGAVNLNQNIPSDFPAEQFVRQAKMSFIRLQAANDTKNLDDIREFCTPEVYAEVVMQMNERGDQVQTTEVKNIQAELLEVHNDHVFSLASVRFTGELIENGGAPETIDEVWFIQKHLHNEDAKWLLAGIKQM